MAVFEDQEEERREEEELKQNMAKRKKTNWSPKNKIPCPIFDEKQREAHLS